MILQTRRTRMNLTPVMGSYSGKEKHMRHVAECELLESVVAANRVNASEWTDILISNLLKSLFHIPLT